MLAYGIFIYIILQLIKKCSTIYQMATPNTLEISRPEISLPTLPSERRPEHFADGERVLAVFFSRYMDKPELVAGEVFDRFTADNPRPNEASGFVSIKTPKTFDIRTGRIIGIAVDSVGLITQDALPLLRDENIRSLWLADGSEAWDGEAAMLEELLLEGIAQGTLGRRIEEPVETPEQQHGRARVHARATPGLVLGKVGVHAPAYV
jgi:hypothetical protein